MNFVKNIHYSQDLELAIIGAILLEKTAFCRLYGIMQPEVFYFDINRDIYDQLSRMWDSNEPIDCVTATLKAHREPKFSFGAECMSSYLTRSTNAVVSTVNLEYHGLLLRQMFIEREMIKLTHNGLIGDGMSQIALIQDKLTKLTQIKANNDFKGMDELMVELSQHMDKVKGQELSGITTGFPTLDKFTGGFQQGGMYIVGARPSVGKSAFMNSMVLGAANVGKNVAVISLEMQNRAISARISSLVTEVEYWRINRNRMIDEQQAQYFYEQISKMAELPIKISDTAEVNIGDIKAKIARLKQNGEVDILFIDYLQLIEADDENGRNREREVAKISRSIKLMAKQFDIPVVILCQLNRLSEQGVDKKPKLYNLRESGSLEQDADGVLLLHRDWQSGIKADENGNSTEREADIIIAKWRDGEVTEYKVGFDGAKMKFFEFNEFKQTQPNLNYKSFNGFQDEQPF